MAVGEEVSLRYALGRPFTHVVGAVLRPLSAVIHRPSGTFVDLDDRLGAGTGRVFDLTVVPDEAGDHVVAIQGAPIERETEQLHDFTKLVLHAGDLQTAWDRVLRTRLELVPLTRPYGIPVGTSFRVQVLATGAPVPQAVVEAEPLNERAPDPLPPEVLRTRVEVANAAGELAVTLDRPGLWVITARADGRQLPLGGRVVRERLRAHLWVHVGP